MAISNGTDIVLFIGGERVAALTASDESYSAAMRDTTTKDGAGDAEYLPGLRSAQLGCSGLFFEQTKNKLKRTEDLSNVIWVKDTGVTITTDSDSAPSPYNRKTVDTITWGAGAFVKQTIADGIFAAGDNIVFSFWGKGSGTIEFQVGDDGGSEITTAITMTSTITQYFITYHAVSGNGVYVKFIPVSATSTKIFGTQLEYGTAPTQYQPSGVTFHDLYVAERAGTTLSCIVSSFLSTEKKYSASAIISDLKRTEPMNANITFTCTLKITAVTTEGTV